MAGESMARGNAAELIRKAGDPQQATFLELFFDLVFVLALTQLSRDLAADLRMILRPF
ncbi:low temperature requirement protein A [Micromonospora musae]|nr:low temperature requirement protein A [Micromonospora musae]